MFSLKLAYKKYFRKKTLRINRCTSMSYILIKCRKTEKNFAEKKIIEVFFSLFITYDFTHAYWMLKQITIRNDKVNIINVNLFLTSERRTRHARHTLPGPRAAWRRRTSRRRASSPSWTPSGSIGRTATKLWWLTRSMELSRISSRIIRYLKIEDFKI